MRYKFFRWLNRKFNFVKDKIKKIITPIRVSGIHGIVGRVALLSWSLIILTLLIFILGTLPYQMNVIKERMRSEASDIASAIGQVSSTAIINNDYGFIVEHCLKLIKKSKSILYITLVRQDGFALVHSKESWQQITLQDEVNLPRTPKATQEFIESQLVNQEVYHYSSPFSYSGINWGRINVGLSVKDYNTNISNLYFRTLILTLVSVMVAFVGTIFFATKITEPIVKLDRVTGEIARGNFKSRVRINSKNEIGRLADSFNMMTESLQNYQDSLERKVEERTLELARINDVLKNEIRERLIAEKHLRKNNLRLEALDRIYRGIISALSIEDIVKETINHVPELFNQAESAAIEITSENVESDFILTRHYDLPGDYEIELEIDEVKNDITNQIWVLNSPLQIGEEVIGLFRLQARPGKNFYEEDEEIFTVLINQLAVAIRQAQLRLKINDNTARLQNSLAEKEVLLKEIHHRVKNNLQVISSLLYLNSRKLADSELIDIFKDSQNRIKSIALVHERLYQSKDLGSIDFNDYIRRLIKDLIYTYSIKQSAVEVIVNVDNIFMNIDTAVPCGLIINELVSNSLKYAFPKAGSKTDCRIKIELYNLPDGYMQLIVEDNGVGISGNMNEIKKHSLGLQLVDTLVKQLDGKLKLENISGTVFTIRFKEIFS